MSSRPAGEIVGGVFTGICELCATRGRVIRSYYGRDLCGRCAVDEAERFNTEDTWPRTIESWPSDPGIAVICSPWGTDAVGALWRPETEPAVGWPKWYPLSRLNPQAWVLEIAKWASKRGVDGPAQLWIHQSAAQAALADPAFDPARPWSTLGVGVEIAFPLAWGATTKAGYRNDSPWWVEDPIHLWLQLCAFAAAVGMRWSFSGANTSDRLLWDHWGSRIHHFVLPPHPGPFGSTTLEGPLVEVIDGSADGKWLYAFDLNANYLGAASNLSLPTSVPREMVYTAMIRAGAKIAPGYWTTDQLEWVTTPTIEGRPGAFQGWGYPESHQYLQPWYKRLRDARAELVGGPALSAVKGVYQAGWSRLMSPRRSDSEWAQRLYQPYWGQAVQANARERMRRRIAELPVEVAAVDTDAIFVFSKREDAGIVAHELGLKLGGGLGQWKAIGRTPGREARKVLDQHTQSTEGSAIARLRELVKTGRNHP